MKIVDDDDRELPWDGKSSGELVRGPWVCSGYFRLETVRAMRTAGSPR
jgi:fatty-acyl-CoA synthase